MSSRGKVSPRFIAYDVPEDRLREAYGVPFEVLEYDLKHGHRCRVLDSNGRRIFAKLALSDLGSVVKSPKQH